MGALIELLRANSSGLLRSRAGGGSRGFYDERNKRSCPGVTPHLKRLGKAHLSRLANSMRKVASAYSGPRARRFLPSSRRRGDAVHRALSHAFTCSMRGTCTCLETFGKEAAQRGGDVTQRLVRAGKAFVAEQRLTPIATELVVVSPPDKRPLGTRIDALMTHQGARVGELVLVSWKTGRRGAVLRTAADRAARTSHLAQLATEAHLLQRTHNVPVHRAQLVYLLQTAAKQPAYFALELDPNPK